MEKNVKQDDAESEETPRSDDEDLADLPDSGGVPEGVPCADDVKQDDAESEETPGSDEDLADLPDSGGAPERVPCADEMCVGTVGSDGQCRYCGLEYDGELPETAEGDPDVDDEDEEGEGEELLASDLDDQADQADETSPESAPLGFEHPDDDNYWKHRQLCPDGACIGVIGADGTCKECGAKP